ncbi:MAG: hypothetical protein PHI05_05200 [Bacilli bacterium]|nr:hypothetical protein [Bacilli bacterium]
MKTKKLQISEELKKKVSMTCKFTCTTLTYQSGKIRSIKGTNAAYVRPHKEYVKVKKLFMKLKRLWNYNLKYKKSIMKLMSMRNHINI